MSESHTEEKIFIMMNQAGDMKSKYYRNKEDMGVVDKCSSSIVILMITKLAIIHFIFIVLAT